MYKLKAIIRSYDLTETGLYQQDYFVEKLFLVFLY